MNAEENIEVWECIICFQSFKSNSDLTIHLRTHIGIKRFTCTICPESFSKKNQLLEHLERHNKKSSSSIEAKKVSKNSQSTKSKVIDTFEEEELLQDIDKVIDEKIRYKEIENEVLEVDLETFSRCTLCCKEFPSTEELRTHLQKHIKLKPFDCTTCLKSLSNKNELLDHVKLCGETVQSNVKKNGLKILQNIIISPTDPTGEKLREKRHICNICNRRFASNTNLRKHLRYHIGVNKYECTYCKKGFIQGHALRVHLRKHTGEKPYQCDICLKRFSGKSNRDNHVMAHNKEYRYKCEKCSKTFIKKINYMVHLKRHFDVQLHNCNICLKSYSTKSSLKQHILSHTKEKTFTCPNCSETFKSKNSLKKHMKLEKV